MKPPIKRSVKWAVSQEYAASWAMYGKNNPEIRKKLTVFNASKRNIPPTRLPDQMRDHVLTGPLDGIRECHLANDVLLLYTHANDLVHLLLVCRHEDLHGPRGKILKAQEFKMKKAIAPCRAT
jgi:addiction module RelE/StbE family toxin